MTQNDEPSQVWRRVCKGLAAVAILIAALAFTTSVFAAQKQAKKAARPKSSAAAIAHPKPVILPEHKPPAPPERAAAASDASTAETAAYMPAVTVTASASTLSAREKQIFSEAIKAAAKNNWGKAHAIVATAHNPLLSKILTWAYLREPGQHASFSERTAFIAANPKWPSTESMRRHAENVIDSNDSLAALGAWFEANPPLTTAGKVAYARALRAVGKTEQADLLAREAWRTGFFLREDEQAFAREFRSFLTTEDYAARVDFILYDEQTTTALRLLPNLDAGHQAVAKARMALIGSAKNMESVVAAVPADLQNDPGLLYDRVKWRREHNNDAGARQLIPPFALGGPRPDLWWRERQTLARDALSAGNVTEAYALAKHHGSTDSTDVADAEFLAGWISLRFLKDGETSLQHFEKIYDVSKTPPFLARGAYWMGRATESLNRPDLAADWYQKAATYVTTYYGQLALARLHGGDLPQAMLPQDPQPTNEERAAFNASELTRALRALMDVDARSYQRAFAQALGENLDTAAARQMTAELFSQSSRVDLGVVVARQAARDKITLVQYGYPAPGWAYPGAPEKALILAITRQESNFDVGAQSSAGAKGLMQLMPPTAKAVAKASKLGYVVKRLTADAGYNVQLGAFYLNSLISDFSGSYILAAAAYNAGPARSRQWIRQFGDPRDPSVDAIDWVEQIPFNETRGYVQRVMENLMIYRAVLGGNAEVPKTLETELARHG